MDDSRQKQLNSRSRFRIASARLQLDLSVWANARAIPALALLAGLDCVAGLVLLRQFSGGAVLRVANGRLCGAAVAAAVLTIGSRWLLSRIEREPPALWT